MILVSACLVGLDCKYDGGNNFNEEILKLVKEKKAIPICPEQLGGLKTPRNPAEIIDDKVFTNDGVDVTKEYNKGAEETLKLAKELNIKKAILKARSPSCGKDIIYDGTFTHTKTNGNGITADLLIKNGIEVITEEELNESIIKELKDE